ncbi:MAG: PLP-dependent lyase/thiolase [Myxococcota bacterium]|nr:PLP-dependent lyase/thiolase [Myxococcota bacterium]
MLKRSVSLPFLPPASHDSPQVWTNFVPEKERSHPLPKSLFEDTAAVRAYVKKTPLQPLEKISKLTSYPVFLKNEAEQRGPSAIAGIPLGGSFKSRGVFMEVYRAFEEVMKSPNRRTVFEKGLRIVTQSTGNHGIAMIYATAAAATLFARSVQSSDPELAKAIYNTEPMIFTLAGLPDIKLNGMKDALESYRQCIKRPHQGQIDNQYPSYEDALNARQAFLNTQSEQARYMDHGGQDIMVGHGTAGLEIHEQLKLVGLNSTKKVAVLLPVGAGGPLGIAAALKESRPNVITIMVQPKGYDAFVRTLRKGSMQKNIKSPPPTETVQCGNEKIDIVFPDGVAVDAPESAAVPIAHAYLDGAVSVDEVQAYNQSGVILLHDVGDHYPNRKDAKVGGTTAITAEALLQLTKSQNRLLAGVDAAVLLGTEGNVSHIVDAHLKARLPNVNTITESSTYRARPLLRRTKTLGNHNTI